MHHRTRAVRTSLGLIALLAGTAAARPALARGPALWEVTIAVRVSATDGKPVGLRIALPPAGPRQRIADVQVNARGLKSSVLTGGDAPHVLLSGKLARPRRVAASFRAETQPLREVVPPVVPVEAPPLELLPFLQPSPLFQSRSILVRDFLETHAAPLLARGNTDVMRAIFEVTRRELALSPGGKSLALDVLRRRQGKRIGIERAFTTFLRCAGVPARLVEGINLKGRTRRKRAFWTEVWTEGRWWPASASEGWIGKLPSSHLPLTIDGERVVRAEPGTEVEYLVQVLPLEQRGSEP